MDFSIILLCLASGVLSGTLSGLLGIGGGIITVPVLYYALLYAGFPEEQVMQTAVCTSLAATFVTTFASTWAHHQKNAIEYPLLKYIAPGLIIGCITGALSSHFLSPTFLRELFGSMAVFFGCYFFFPKFPHPRFASHPNYTLFFFGLAIGCLSSLLGIGGGIFTVPILLGYQIHLKPAIAASSASTLITAFIGSLVYLFVSFGSVNLPAFLSISFASVLTAPLGVKLSHTLPTPAIKRIFAIVLAATGLAMLLR